MVKVYDKTCGVCEKPFQTEYVRRLYCSAECSVRANHLKARAGNARRRQRRVVETGACPCCGQLWPRNKGPAPWTMNDGK